MLALMYPRQWKKAYTANGYNVDELPCFFENTRNITANRKYWTLSSRSRLSGRANTKLMGRAFKTPNTETGARIHLSKSETLVVNNRWSGFVVFLLGNPHLLESRQGGQDRTTDPNRVFSFWRSNDLHLHRRWSQSGNLLLHSLSNTWEHSSTTRHNNVTVQLLSNINITLGDGVVGGLVNTSSLQSKRTWVEQHLWSSESLVTNGDDLSVRQLVRLLDGRRLGRSLQLLVEVQGNVTKLLLDVSDDFSLGSGGESVTSLGENLHQVVGQVSTGQVNSHDSVWKRETSVDRNNVSNTITRVQNNTGSSTRRVKRQHSLDRNVESRNVERFKQDLGHLFSVGLRVHWSLSQQDWVLFWGNSQLVVESVVPDLLHVVPVGNDTVFNRVSQGQDTSLGLSLVSNVGVLLTHTDHDTLMSWSSHNRREHGSWGVITGETGFAHTRTIVND
ncbi:hypothetical protein OGAPHI_003091 [Ogataea philodendri]|uniref:Uncharacterized protein n=1 Tax=Ogataea philodendri TaxID=1378263 RepID=A0A9P8P8R5_9ASCO|nr:uncharacterized protein OGAPHI_003091 [Ogataea philodendri]KAH3667442.1 hypothetical protein OGAPHI_003091 [Ogataea philodendri]